MKRYDLEGKVALVTGGARGIGLATGRELVRRGARVVLADLDEGDARRAAVDVDVERAIGVAADVRDYEACEAAVRAALDRWHRLDVVVANAGIPPTPSTARAADPDEFRRVLDVNLHGVWHTVRAALPQVTANHGHVVVVSSIYAFMNGIGAAPYAMSKAAVEQLGRSLRVELVPHGVGVTVAYFGFIDTAMVHQSIDSDPLGDRIKRELPAPLRKRLPPEAAGKALAAAVAHRRPTVVRPRRWQTLSVLRGVINPYIDRHAATNRDLQAIVRELDARHTRR